MAIVVSLLGIFCAIVGGILLYVFQDPRFGDGLMLESYNPRKEAWGARTGLGLVIFGGLLQLGAVLIAMD